MDVSKEGQQPSIDPSQHSAAVDEPLRAKASLHVVIAYSMDALIPGFYLWLGAFKLRIGGSLSEATYPGTLHSFAGISLVLPGYRIYTTYHGSYDPQSSMHCCGKNTSQ
jgi:hypothetical protein